MSLNMNAIGKKIGPITKEYTWKDVVLYALGVGAGADELEYCYEKNLHVIPSFSIAAIFDFLAHIGANANVDLSGILHGEQELVFFKPIPPEGKLITEGHITNYYDLNNKGAVIIGEGITSDNDGKKLFANKITLFARKDGNFGGTPPPKNDVLIPDRDPDFVVQDQPSDKQHLLYRLSGDTFQLHVDPEFAKLVGFEKPIMHGLCTHGYACRALIKSLVPSQHNKVRRMACRFSKPLYPGTPIKTLIWKTGDGKAVWRTVNALTNEVVIDKGEFEFGDIKKQEIRFDGQVAIITGAGAGLGRVYAIELAKRGAKVVVNDLGGARDGQGSSSAPADLVVNEIKAFGGQACANYDSVSTPEGGKRIVQTALDTFGTVDILINNAGILRDKTLIKMEPEHWQSVMDVHLNGAFYMTQAAFNVMKERGYGRIIMTTSAAGLYGNFGQTNYAAAKMGLVGFMNTIKLEGEKYNIKVNTVAPLAASRLTEDVMPPEIFQKSKPEFVAPLVLFLCSKQCPVNGRIYNAGMGAYNRAAVMTGPGIVLGNENKIPSPENIQDSWDKISSLSGAKEYYQLNGLVLDIVDAFSAKPQTDSKATGFVKVPDVFNAMPSVFVKDAAAGVSVVFQYEISGKDSGDWFCAIENQTCTVSKGSHEKPSCTLKMADVDFLDMMNGKTKPMQAYTSGKLKIGGDVMKSQLIQKLFKI